MKNIFSFVIIAIILIAAYCIALRSKSNNTSFFQGIKNIILKTAETLSSNSSSPENDSSSYNSSSIVNIDVPTHRVYEPKTRIYNPSSKKNSEKGFPVTLTLYNKQTRQRIDSLVISFSNNERFLFGRESNEKYDEAKISFPIISNDPRTSRSHGYMYIKDGYVYIDDDPSSQSHTLNAETGENLSGKAIKPNVDIDIGDYIFTLTYKPKTFNIFDIPTHKA